MCDRCVGATEVDWPRPRPQLRVGRNDHDGNMIYDMHKVRSTCPEFLRAYVRVVHSKVVDDTRQAGRCVPMEAVGSCEGLLGSAAAV
jgi:hypothetical protein